MLNTGFPYTPVLSIATCVHPTPLSQSPNCNSSSVIVAKVRISLRPFVTRHATTVLACTSSPQQHSYTTSIPSSCRSWLENRTCHKESALRAHREGGNRKGCQKTVLGSG